MRDSAMKQTTKNPNHRPAPSASSTPRGGPTALAFRAAVLMVALCATALYGQPTHTWTGASDDLWSVAGNWSGGVPVNGVNLAFGASAQTFNYDDIASLQIGTLTFIAAAP